MMACPNYPMGVWHVDRTWLVASACCCEQGASQGLGLQLCFIALLAAAHGFSLAAPKHVPCSGHCIVRGSTQLSQPSKALAGYTSVALLRASQVLLYYPLYDALMAEAQRRQGSSIGSSTNRTSSESSTALSSHSLGGASSSSSSSSRGFGTGSAPGYATPMLCGAVARTVAVFAVAPLELARTLQQVGAHTAHLEC